MKLILVVTLLKPKSITGVEKSLKRKKQAENRKTLVRISRKLDIGHFLKMGTGEREHDKIYDNDDNLAETLEAMLHRITYPYPAAAPRVSDPDPYWNFRNEPDVIIQLKWRKKI